MTAFVSSHQYPNNRGHVLIAPNEHFENIYDLPIALGTQVHETARTVALAMKAAYRCGGISTRQHNEPAGNQDVWHYHLHVFPRYAGDELYATKPSLMQVTERAEYAQKIRLRLPEQRDEGV